jgi:hypothetical protein
MNKLTKIGVSALCGSLASVAANAGTMEVLGGATATWSSTEGTDTGNPIGMNSALTFKGTGELDNGTTFTLTVTGTDQMAYTSGSIAMVTPGMGTFTIVQAAGGAGVDRYDDMMPTAWEETNGTSLATGLQTVAGVGTTMNVEWTLPSMVDGLSAHIAVTPTAGAGVTNDKASGGSGAAQNGGGYDIALSHNALLDGLNVFAGRSVIEQHLNVGKTATSGATGDRTQYVMGATYAAGSFTVGYQESRDNLQATAISTTNSYYSNQAFGVSFNVNDNLSLSYGSHKSKNALNSGASVELEAESLQMAYTMGGMSIKIAESSVDNGSYTSGTSKDRDATTIALTLAF